MTKMSFLFAKQGLPSDDWMAYAEAKLARRKKNIAAAHEVLTRNHIHYEELEDGWFKVDDTGHIMYYNPPTGQWTDHSSRPKHKGYGVRNLVRYLRGKVD